MTCLPAFFIYMASRVSSQTRCAWLKLWFGFPMYLDKKSELDITGIDLIYLLLYLILPISTCLFQTQTLFCSLNLSSPFSASPPFVLAILSAENPLFLICHLSFILQGLYHFLFFSRQEKPHYLEPEEFNMINECLYFFGKTWWELQVIQTFKWLEEPKNTIQSPVHQHCLIRKWGRVRKPRSQLLASGCTSVAVSRAWEMGL